MSADGGCSSCAGFDEYCLICEGEYECLSCRDGFYADHGPC